MSHHVWLGMNQPSSYEPANIRVASNTRQDAKEAIISAYENQFGELENTPEWSDNSDDYTYVTNTRDKITVRRIPLE